MQYIAYKWDRSFSWNLCLRCEPHLHTIWAIASLICVQGVGVLWPGLVGRRGGRGFESGCGHSVSAPQNRGLDDGASGIGQANSRPTKSDLHLGKFHSADYCSMRPCTLASGCYCKDEMRHRPVHVSRIEKAVFITFVMAYVRSRKQEGNGPSNLCRQGL